MWTCPHCDGQTEEEFQTCWTCRIPRGSPANVGSSYLQTYNGEYRGNWISECNHRTPWLLVGDGFSRPGRSTEKPWQNFQLSNALLQNKLDDLQPKLEPFIENARARELAIDAFFEYAYKWY